MQVSYKIQKSKESEGAGLLSKGTLVDMYILTATFTPSELEKKIFNEHPLFKNMLFMEYNEIDKFTTGVIFKDKHAVDQKKRISVGAIYNSPTYTFRAYSVRRILELRELVNEAAKNFVEYTKELEQLEKSEIINFE